MYQFISIERTVLNQITPTKKDNARLMETIQQIKTLIQQEITRQDQKPKITLVGSTAKDTYLRHSLDIDIFLVYPVEKQKEEIADATRSIGKKILTSTEECYAEHPYIRGTFNDYKVELVPCYDIKDPSQKRSAVDRTPHHTNYVKKTLTEQQKKEVRLFKQFLKGIHCYGAEAEIQGFSGYLCELLIIKYGSFHRLIQQAQQFKTGEQMTLTNQTIPSFPDPLIFIDPVDAERNVASAISPKTFEFFIKACSSYLKNPLITYFFPTTIRPWSIQKIKTVLLDQSYQYIGIVFSKPKILSENLYPQLRKALRSITAACENHDFPVYDTQFHIDTFTNQVYLLIKTSSDPLPPTYTHMGPPINLKENTKDFLSKWSKHKDLVGPPFEKNGRTYVNIKRPYRHITHFLEEYLHQLSMGKHIDKKIQNEFNILETKELIKPPLASFWTRYLDNKNPWER